MIGNFLLAVRSWFAKTIEWQNAVGAASEDEAKSRIYLKDLQFDFEHGDWFGADEEADGAIGQPSPEIVRPFMVIGTPTKIMRARQKHNTAMGTVTVVVERDLAELGMANPELDEALRNAPIALFVDWVDDLNHGFLEALHVTPGGAPAINNSDIANVYRPNAREEVVEGDFGRAALQITYGVSR